MADIRINCPADFSMYIERIIRESRSVPGIQTQKALEEFAMFCFNEGFKSGKLPENHPRYKRE